MSQIKFTEEEMDNVVEQHELTEIEILGLLKWIKEVEDKCIICRDNLRELHQQSFISYIELPYGFCNSSINDLYETVKSLKQYWENCSFARK